MIGMLRKSLSLVSLAALAGLLPPGSAAADEQTLKMFAVWQGEGHIVQTGSEAATYIGTFSGPVYIDTTQGPVSAGQLVCPVVIQINTKDKTQKGTGQCAITGPQGNQVYLTLDCTGVPLVGCAGESKVTGGTGPFAKIEGGGHFVVRSSEHQMAAAKDASIKDTTSGIIFWQALTYKLP